MAAPKLPPRPKAPKLPGYHTPAPKPPTQPKIYRWGQSNPAYARGPMKGQPAAPGALSYGPGKTTPGGSYGTSAAASPGAPGTAATAPTSAVLGVDPGYDQQMGALGRQRDTTLSALTGQRTQGLLNYGYNEDQSTGALAFDPSNPYSQAAQMKKRYDESRTGTGNRMAAGGNLYAGSYQQGQDIINKDQGRAEDAQLKSLISFLAGNTGAKAKAQSDYEFGAGGAYGDRVARAPSMPGYVPSSEGTPATAGTPAGAAASKGIPDGTYTNKTAPPGLLAGNNKIADGYVVVVKNGKVVDLRKQR